VSLNSIQIDREGLEKKIKELSNRNRDIHGIRIYQDGNVLFDQTYNGYSYNELHPVYSCTKSVLSLLIGIAIEEGFIESVNSPIISLLRKYENSIDIHKKNITLKDLLTMRSGLEWDEFNSFGKNNGVWKTFLESDRPAAYVLEKDLVDNPGSHYNYNSGVSHLLSIIIHENTGYTTKEFAKTYVFDKMDIKDSDIQWKRDKNGIVYGGHGLALIIKDLEKFGILYLEKGIYNGIRVVSEEWISESVISHSKHTRGYEGYGYQWWKGSVNNQKFYGAFGHAGQRVYVFQDLKLVITFLGNVKPEFGIQERLIKKYILKL